MIGLLAVQLNSCFVKQQFLLLFHTRRTNHRITTETPAERFLQTRREPETNEMVHALHKETL